MARRHDFIGEAHAFAEFHAHRIEGDEYREPPDHPDDRIIVRGGENDPDRRPSEECLQNIHLFWPDLSHWGRA